MIQVNKTEWLKVLVMVLALLPTASAMAASWSKNMSKADKAYNEGRYGEAEKRLQAAIKKAEKTDNDEQLAVSLAYLGKVYDEQQKPAEAESSFERALQLVRRSPRAGTREHGFVFGYTGSFYLQSGRYPEAEPLLQQALGIGLKTRDQQFTFGNYLNLGDLNQALARYGDALGFYQEALKIAERRERWWEAVVYGKLGGLYTAQGSYPQAEEALKQGREIMGGFAGPEDYPMGIFYSRLGKLYVAQGRHREAEPLLRRALVIREKAGAEVEVAFTLQHLGQLYIAKSTYAEAKPALERALAIRERVHHTDHPLTAITLNSLGELHRLQGEYPKAEPLLQRALEVQEKTLPEDHPDVATSLESYAALLRATNREPQAAKLETRAKAIRANRKTED